MNKKKVLIVDDEKDLVDMLKLRLESMGYDVLEAYDGKSGLDKAKEEKPDLIILDLMLPKMDGYQLCRILKFDEEYKNIPIVMLTARAQQKDKEQGVTCGANEYVTKPFEPKELVSVIHKLVGSP